MIITDKNFASDFVCINTEDYCGNVGSQMFDLEDAEDLGFDKEQLASYEVGKPMTYKEDEELLSGVIVMRIR